MALTLSAIDSSWEFWGGACWWGRRLIRLHEFQQWCWWCEPVPFVILDLDGVRTLLLCEGQLKRMSHHPHLLVPSDQLSCFDVRRWRLAVSTLCSGMAYRKHLQCQRSGYALVLPSPPCWPVCSSWCGARDLHFFLPPFLQRCLGCHLPVCIFLWWWWGIFGHSNGRFWSSSTCCSLDDVYIHILYRQWCTGKRFAPGLCVLLPDDPPVWELLREHLFSTWPLSWLSVVWTCCYGAGLLDAAQVPQCGGLWTLLPLLQSDHRLHYSLSATTRGWMVPTFFVVFVLKKLQWRWWTCI